MTVDGSLSLSLCCKERISNTCQSRRTSQKQSVIHTFIFMETIFLIYHLIVAKNTYTNTNTHATPRHATPSEKEISVVLHINGKNQKPKTKKTKKTIDRTRTTKKKNDVILLLQQHTRWFIIEIYRDSYLPSSTDDITYLIIYIHLFLFFVFSVNVERKSWDIFV